MAPAVPDAIPQLVVPTTTREQLADWALGFGLCLAAAGAVASVPLMNLGLAFGFAGALLGRCPIHRTPGFLPAALLAGWMLLSTALSPWRDQFGPSGWTYSWIAVSVWAVAVPRWIVPAARTVLIAGALVAMLAVGQFLVGYDIEAKPLRLGLGDNGVRLERASGLYSHHIRFGDAMAVWGAWAAILAPLAIHRPGWVRIIQVVGLGLGFMGSVVSSARGALLALAAAWWGALAGAVSRRRLVLGTVGIVALLALAVGLFAWLWPDRVARALSGNDSRTVIWNGAWQAFSDRPWLGVGNDGYNAAIRSLVAQGRAVQPIEGPDAGHAHNAFLSLLVQYGIPGLTLYLVWLGVILRHVWQHRWTHPAALPLALATVGALVAGGLTEDLANLASSRYQLFFGLALAIGCTAIPRRPEA